MFDDREGRGLIDEARRDVKCIAGLLKPTRGQVLVSGTPVDGVGRDRGMVFQAYTSFGWLTIRENVEYGLRLAGVPAAERTDLVMHYLKLVGLGLSSAVLIDATIVRMVLVPATMELLGDRNWWFPRWLDRIVPKIAVEAPAVVAPAERELEPAA